VPIVGAQKKVDGPKSLMLKVDIAERVFNTADGQDLHAIGQLSFSLKPNSFTIIVGPSGCGKTTTLRMILGLDKGYKGTISTALGKEMAAVFQEPRLLPWRTVEQNVRLALPASKQNVSLTELFSVLGLTDVSQFYPSQLSLGLARRAAIARAFAVEPSLLILDEPFVSLDEPTAERLRALLLDVWQARPTTVLMVTHNVREAAELADEILVFSDRPTTLVDTISIDTPRDQRDDRLIQSVVDNLKGTVVSEATT